MRTRRILIKGNADFWFFMMRLWRLLGRRAGALARRLPGVGRCSWRTGGLCGWIFLGVLVVAAVSGCSRHPDSHASAAATRPTRASMATAIRAASARSGSPVAVFGVVTGAGNKIVSGYRVAVFPSGGHPGLHGLSALTNAAGMFALNGELRPGKYTFEITAGRVLPVFLPSHVWPPIKYRFEASKGEVTVRVPAVIAPSAQWFTLLHLELPRATSGPRERRRAVKGRGVAVFGRITKPDGVTPLLGASVGIYHVGNRSFPQGVTVAIPNELGLFVFKKGRLGPGKYWISAVVRSWHPQVCDTVAFSDLTIAASSRPDIVLRLKAGAGSVKGRVVDSMGHAVRKATVRLEGTKRPSILHFYTAVTNAEGHYALEYVPRGTYMGTVGWREYGSLPVAVVVGRRPVHKDFRVGR